MPEHRGRGLRLVGEPEREIGLRQAKQRLSPEINQGSKLAKFKTT
jgi:hypothetical protein